MSRHSFALAFAACAFAFAPAAQAAVQVTIDKSIQQMTVEVDGRPLYHWPVSTGKGSQYDTPNGKFKAFRMERDHFSKEWDPREFRYQAAGHPGLAWLRTALPRERREAVRAGREGGGDQYHRDSDRHRAV